MRREKGLTLPELVVLIVLVTIIASLAVPKLLEEIRVRKAIHDVQVIAGACQEFKRKFGRFPKSLEELVKTKRSEEWDMPFLKEIPHNPWGGRYILDLKRLKVGIPEYEEKVPSKYRLGGIAEISEVIEEGASLW